jgi:hypothetical protein
VVKLISVERMDSAFLFLLLAAYSGSNRLLGALISSKGKVRPKTSFRIHLCPSKPFSAV